jgi:hypothetical protein
MRSAGSYCQKRCAIHSQPGRAAELGSRGGRRRAVYSTAGDLKDFKAPKTAADLCDLLAESIVEIRSRRLDPKIANALGYLGTSYLRALEVSDIEKRLEDLEHYQRKIELPRTPASPTTMTPTVCGLRNRLAQNTGMVRAGL